MRKFYLDSHNKSIIFKVFIFFVFLFFLQIFISYIAIRQFTLKEREDSLRVTVDEVKKDLIYKNGKWDMSLYNADPDTPTPNSVNPFPLYVMTRDGFVIERSRPIKGLLDSSDFKRILNYQSVQTVSTPTNETWRVLAEPINKNGKIVGAIMVSIYNPSSDNLKEIDSKLQLNLEKISEKIQVKNDKLTSTLDPRSIVYDVAYEVVDSFNKIIVIDGRPPSFIDVSYVATELNAPHKRIIKDTQTDEPFLLVSDTIMDNNGNLIGIIVTGKSIFNLYSVLKNYIIFSTLVGFIIIFPLTIITAYGLRKELFFLLKQQEEKTKEIKKSIKSIFFDKRKCNITIDQRKIDIAYASNQYYLLKAIFSYPKKRWERDELLELFGEKDVNRNGRNIYDTMIAINKKIGIKLIINQQQTYRINPELLPFISKM